MSARVGLRMADRIMWCGRPVVITNLWAGKGRLGAVMIDAVEDDGTRHPAMGYSATEIIAVPQAEGTDQ